jgi:hypothetical protein
MPLTIVWPKPNVAGRCPATCEALVKVRVTKCKLGVVEDRLETEA